MDREAMIHGVAKSRTRLSNWNELNWGALYILSILVLYQIYNLQTFSPFHGLSVIFPFPWQCPLNHKSFQVWQSTIYLFPFFVSCAFSIISKKSLCNTKSWRYTPLFSSKSSMVLAFTCSLIHLEIIFVYGVGGGANIASYMWIFSCIHHTIVKIILSSTELSWQTCQKSVDPKCEGLLLDSEFYTTDIYPYTSTTLFWLPCLSSKF